MVVSSIIVFSVVVVSSVSNFLLVLVSEILLVVVSMISAAAVVVSMFSVEGLSVSEVILFISVVVLESSDVLSSVLVLRPTVVPCSVTSSTNSCYVGVY